MTRGRKQQRETKGPKQLSKENGSTALRPAIGKKPERCKKREEEKNYSRCRKRGRRVKLDDRMDVCLESR